MIGAAVALVAVKPGILPTPLPPNPMAVLLLVHVKGAARYGTRKIHRRGGRPRTERLVGYGVYRRRLGFTVMVNVMGVPGQPPAVGVTVMVLLIGVAPALVAVNDGSVLLPKPLNRWRVAACPSIGGSAYGSRKGDRRSRRTRTDRLVAHRIHRRRWVYRYVLCGGGRGTAVYHHI